MFLSGKMGDNQSVSVPVRTSIFLMEFLFVFSSPLRRAISRGLKADGNLVNELNELDDYSIQSRKDAKAICEALRTLPSDGPMGKSGFSSPLYAVSSLFQDVESAESPAFEVLYEEGLPELVRIFDETLAIGREEDEDDLLFLLKILAMYGSREGAERVIEAARRSLKSEGYLWHVVFSVLTEGHPQRDYIFEALSDPIPNDFIAIGLLDSATASAIDGNLEHHPFDSPDGYECLRRWLTDSDSDHSSYAHSATAALPFVQNPARDQLLALAMDHFDTGVQIEAAWAAGKLGREAGLKVLSRFCLDVNHSEVAQRYLHELDREDLVPDTAADASFQAKAMFSSWLAHPNELGEAPDELEIIDHRELAWPPEKEVSPFWIIQYRQRDRTGLEEDDVDCGLVGSVTWCFFTYKMHQRPPEDVYAIHAYWEMEHGDLIDENEVTDPSEYERMLSQWQGEPLESATITQVVEVSPKLDTPSRFIALARATLQGGEGWVVLDGERSQWYPKSEQPEDTHETAILKIHIGRQLLGFTETPDRKNFLTTSPKSRSDQEWIETYEGFVAEASQADAKRQEELLGTRSLLARHFEKYIDMAAGDADEKRVSLMVELYDRCLEIAALSDDSIREELHDSFGFLGCNFESYIDALQAQNASEKIKSAVKIFEPFWEHNLGFGQLGAAAFQGGDHDVAEYYLLKLREGLESYHRSSGMSTLAKIWHERGESQKAQELLVDCLRKMVTEVQESEYNSDREMFTQEFHEHRATFLRLFPGSEQQLRELGIPDEPK